MIDGVEVKMLRVMPDDRGRLMEILRKDDEIYEGFGQVYMTTAYPGVVKAWHYHEHQHDFTTCVFGMIKYVLFDSREGSPTFGETNEFVIGEYSPLLVKVPPMVWHGFKNIGLKEAIIVNTVTRPFNYLEPDEKRADPHDNITGYDWSRKDG